MESQVNIPFIHRHLCKKLMWTTIAFELHVSNILIHLVLSVCDMTFCCKSVLLQNRLSLSSLRFCRARNLAHQFANITPTHCAKSRDCSTPLLNFHMYKRENGIHIFFFSFYFWFKCSKCITDVVFVCLSLLLRIFL
jgi:hypothetical protein